MHHPRRNEVYRDVGSDPHEAADPDFIDVHEIRFEPDAALLLCSDGLTDSIESSSIHQIVTELAGQPNRVVKALMEAANVAGGKDNITVVYVEGERFASSAGNRGFPASETTRRLNTSTEDQRSTQSTNQRRDEPRQDRGSKAWAFVRIALVALVALVAGVVLARLFPSWRFFDGRGIVPAANAASIVVLPTGSIGAALERAAAGSEVIVEPGEYHETLLLRNGVRLVSRVPREATIRLSGTGAEADPAVVASGITGAAFVGFRIVGDAATPLGTGVLVKDSEVSVVDVEVMGAKNVAIDIDSKAHVSVSGSDIRDNPGAALAIRSGAC